MTDAGDRLVENERFELLARATRDAVWDWNLEAGTVWWNDGFLEIFGYARADLEPGPESWYTRIHPDDREMTLHIIHEVIDRGGTNWSHEYRFRRVDGSYATIFDRGYIIHQQNKPVRMVGSMQDVSMYRELLRQQRESEERYRMALEATKLGVWDYNLEINELRWDDRCRALFGLSPGVLVNWETFIAGLHPDDRDFTVDAVRRALDPAIRSYYNIEYRSVGLEDGEIRWLRATGQGYFTEEAVAYRFVGTIQDISADKEKDTALRASEQRFRTLIAEAPVAIGVYTTADVVIEEANPVLLAMWSKDASVIGRPMEDAIPELRGQPFVQILKDVYRTGTAYQTMEQRADLFDGNELRPFWFNFTYKPLKDTTGNVYAILHIAVDVTTQVVARQQLKQAQESLATAIDVAELGTWQVYPLTGESFFSDRIRGWAGFEENEPMTLDETLACVPDNESVIRAIRESTRTEGDGRLAVEYQLINRKTGQKRIVSSQGQAFFNEEGEAQMIVGASYDITLQRATEQELSRLVAQRTHELELANYDLQRSNANLQQFAYVASHDLQEPLRKIQSFSSLLQDQYTNQIDERGRDILSRIQQAGERMSTLIRDLLNYSRISTRQQMFEPVSLQKILDDVIDTLDLRIQQTGSVINARKLPMVRGDESQLRQLFQNLLSNAMKFISPDRTPVIDVSTASVTAEEVPGQSGRSSQAATFIRIDVTDNGIGFDQRYAERIFQVFQRLHTHSQYAGTGVGLAICQRVAENHGGSIAATSQLEQGTTFSLYLPS